MHQTAQHQHDQTSGFAMDQEGGGQTMVAPPLALKASAGFGSTPGQPSNSTPLQLRHMPTPGANVGKKDLLQQLRTWLSWWNVPEKKVLNLLKQLSSSEKATVLSQPKVYLDKMTKAFNPWEMATALKSLGETDSYRAIQYLFKAKSWFNNPPKGDDLQYFIKNGSSASLLNLQKDKKLYQKIYQLWKPGISGRPHIEYLDPILAHLAQSPATIKDEKAGGISSKEKIGGTTRAFVNLRSRPVTHSSTFLGELDGGNYPVTISGKKIQDGFTWYKATFKDPSTFKKLLSPKVQINKDNLQAKEGHYAWISAKGLDLHVSYAQFLRQLKGWEKANSKLTVKQRITKLRQMGHDSGLPFGTVIGKDQGKYFQDHRPDFSDLHTIIGKAQGVVMPDGKKVDMYHLIVGLDVLEKDNPRRNQQTVYSYDIGENYAAATWAGDIGAGVSDMIMMEGSSKSEYEQDFIKKKADHKKKKRPYDITDQRRKYYYNSRAPEADLLADIDSWVAASFVGDKGMNSISTIVERFYGGVSDKTGQTVKKNRTKAIENFLRNYNFRKVDGLLSQSDPVKRMTDQVYKFSKIWAIKTTWIPTSGIWNYAALFKESKNMTKMFIIWLEKLAKQHKVKL